MTPPPKFDPSKPFTPAQPSQGAAPKFDPSKPFTSEKKKDGASTSSSTATAGGAVQPSASATTPAASPSALTLPSFLQTRTAQVPQEQATQQVDDTAPQWGVSQSNIPSAVLFRNPFLSSGPQDQSESAYRTVLSQQQAPGVSPKKLTPEQVARRNAMGISSPGSTTAINDMPAYYEQLSYATSVAQDKERQRILQSMEGTPEYYAATAPGVAMPVKQETPMDQARRYYASYLQAYNPQALQDHETSVQGLSMAVKENADLARTEIAEGSSVAAGQDVAQAKTYATQLQKQQAQFDSAALNFAGKGAFNGYVSATDELSSKYPDQLKALEELNAWPKYAEGNPFGMQPGSAIITSEQDQQRYDDLAATLQQMPQFTDTLDRAVTAGVGLNNVHRAAMTYMDQYPLWKEQFNLARESEAYGADEGPYGQSWVSGNIINPAIRTVASAVESLAYIPKALGEGDEYGWTDKLYDIVQTGIDTTYPNLFPMAGNLEVYDNPYTGQKEQVFETAMLPSVVQSATQMGMIIGLGTTPAAFGATGSGAATLGQVTAATALSMNDFYKAGKDAGMSEREAQTYSIVSGVISGSFMAVNPMGAEAAQMSNIVKNTTEGYVKALVEGGTTSAARAAAVKNIAKEIAGVNMVGIGQKLSEYGVNYLANTVSGANLDTGDHVADDMWNVVVMSTLMGAGFGSVRYGKDIVAPNADNQYYRESLYAAAKDPLRYKEALAKMAEKGEVSADKLVAIRSQIDMATEALNKMPDTLTPREKAEALPLVVEKASLESKMKAADDVFAPEYQKQIDAVDEKIQKVTGVEKELDKAEAEKNKQAALDESVQQAMQEKPKEMESQSPGEKAAEPQQPPLAREGIDIEKAKESLKSLSYSEMNRTASYLEQRIKNEVKQEKMTKEDGDKALQEIRDVRKQRIEEVKGDLFKKIDEARDKTKVIAKKMNLISDAYVTKPDGTRVPVQKNTMFDLEVVIDKSVEYLKKSIEKGIDAQVAVNNWIAAVKSHQAYKNMASQKGAEWEKEFDEKIFGTYRTAAEEMQKVVTEKDKVYSRLESKLMANEEFRNTEMFKAFEEKGMGHVPQGEKMQANDAADYIKFHEEHGQLDTVLDVINDDANGMKSDVRGMLANKLMERYTELAGKASPEEAAQYYKKAGEALSVVDSELSVSGRALRNVSKTMYSILEKHGVDGLMNTLANADVQKIDRVAKQKGTKKRLKEITSESNEAFSENKETASEKIIDKLEKKFPELDDMSRRKLLANMLGELNEKGKLSDPRVSQMYKDVLFGQEWSAEKQAKAKEALGVIKKAVDVDKALESDIKSLREKFDNDSFGKTDAEVNSLRDKFYKDVESLINNKIKAQYAGEKAKMEIETMFAPERDIWDTLNWLHKGGLLGLHSGFVNIVGNAVSVPFRAAGALSATGLDLATTGALRTYERVTGKEYRSNRSHDIIAQIAGIQRVGVKMGAKEVVQRVIKGIEPYGGTLDKLEIKRNVSVFDAWRDTLSKKKPLQERFIEDKIASSLEATLGAHAVPIFRFMALGDALPREMARYGRLYEIAVTTKGMKDPADIMQFVAHPDEVSKASADDFAKRLVYQQEKGLGATISSNVQNLASSLETHLIKMGEEGRINPEFARHMSGMLRIVRSTQIPFVRTPVNMLSEVAYFSVPAFGYGMATFHMADSVRLYRKASALSGAEKVAMMERSNLARNRSMSSFGKATTALAVMNIVSGLVKRGLISGKESDQGDERQFQFQTVGPYKINMSALRRRVMGDPKWDTIQATDQWGSYDQLGTVGMAMAAYTNAMKRDGYIPGMDASLGIVNSLPGAGMSAVSKMLDLSFTKSTSALLQALTDDSGNKFARWKANTLYSISSIAVPNDVAALSKASDPYMRETKTGAEESAWDLYKNKMSQATFQGSNLPKKVNMWGVPTPAAPQGIDPYFHMFISPTRSGEMQSMQLGFEIYQKYSVLPNDDPNKSKYVPSDPGWTLTMPRSSGLPSTKVPLSPKEHEALLISIGNERARLAESYVFSKEWDTDSDEVRAQKIDYIYRAADKLGKQQFIIDSPKFLAIYKGLPVPTK